MSQQFSESYGSVWIQCWGIMPKPLLPLRGVHADEKTSLKLRNHLVLKSWKCYVMLRADGFHLFQHCNTLSQSRIQLRSCCLKTFQRMTKNISKNDMQLSIKRALGSQEVYLEIGFITSTKPLFELMTNFQMKEQVIHMFYPSSVKLLKTATSRLMKSQGLHWNIWSSIEAS